MCLGSRAISTDSVRKLAFVQRLRDERRFPDVDALREQIAADVRGPGDYSIDSRCKVQSEMEAR